MNAYRTFLEQKLAAAKTESRFYVLDLAECAEGFAECGDVDRANECAEKALQAARMRSGEGAQFLFKGEEQYAEYAKACVYVAWGQFEEALPRLFRITNHAESGHLSDLQIKSLRALGVCYVRISMFTTALEYLTKSRTLTEELGEMLQESLACSVIGDAHFGLDDAQTALQYYREALRLLDTVNDLSADDNIRYKSPILYNLASAHKMLGGTRQATLYYEQALAAYKFQQNVNGIVLSLRGVADMYASQERFEKALELLFAAFEVAQHHAGESEKAWVNFSIGDVYCKAGRHEKALEYLRVAESSVDSSQIVVLVAKVHESLSVCYKALGDFEKAFYHLEIFHNIREQTALQDGKRSVKYLQQGFEMERAQKEAEIYRLKNVELTHAQQEVERLLLNILPTPIAQRLRQGEYRIADTYDDVTVVFIDLVGFTRLATQYSAVHIVGMLDHLFSEFDDLTLHFGLEKIKTIGDAYMAVAGLPFPQRDHVRRAADFALAVQGIMRGIGAQYKVQARIGMHSGSAVAGVIGKSKFVYDLWGDTVNIASRMESHGEAGKIHVSEEVKRKYEGSTEQHEGNAQVLSTQVLSTQVPYFFEERGEIEIKGKGLMRTWFLVPNMEHEEEEPIPEFIEEAEDFDIKE